MSEEVEKILVVPAEWANNLCQPGFTSDIHPNFLAKLPEIAFFMDRPAAEINPKFRQIIPYILVKYQNKYLTVTRRTTQTEVRLHNKVSFGIGGHINPIDGDTTNILDAGLRRELSEELATDNPPKFDELKLLGLLRDDVNELEQVHLGVVMLWETTEPIAIRETDKMDGEYLTLNEIGARRERLENWSRLVYDHLGVMVS
ncbi:MAG: hypothetical protein WC805_00525 [Patescibacteria group bacterium]|jgi:predicted NUDIX family phosphoesterase